MRSKKTEGSTDYALHLLREVAAKITHRAKTRIKSPPARLKPCHLPLLQGEDLSLLQINNKSPRVLIARGNLLPITSRNHPRPNTLRVRGQAVRDGTPTFSFFILNLQHPLPTQSSHLNSSESFWLFWAVAVNIIIQTPFWALCLSSQSAGFCRKDTLTKG